MIVAHLKPLAEIRRYLAPHRRVLLLGCNECVTVCQTGGSKETAVLAAALRLAPAEGGEPGQISEFTLERQCDPEYAEKIADLAAAHDALASLACGCGVQTLAARFPGLPVYPLVNTTFLGASERSGVWAERCQGCGDCVLAYTGGICPVARCAKRIFNGPCGGSSGGKCEISPEVDCAWQLIWDRLQALGRTDLYEAIMEPKDWRTARGGGPRKLVREEL
ncbi:MAG: methylenetetrahydrofolate reductase C-terminal domain-containing protein [Deltaproteobacteria bacterium]|nr:methylenetetrahydrofolate reductase C-terminal domain-containing protein [Deltaproteobacteria bacterium]